MLRDLEKQFLALPREFPASRSLESVSGVIGRIGSREILIFCGNNHLGYDQDPRRIAAIVSALERDGSGVSAPSGSGGTRMFQQRLASRLQFMRHAEDCVLGASPQEMYEQLFAVLADDQDLIAVDPALPAALRRSCLRASSRAVVVPMQDLELLERTLRQGNGTRRRIVVVESVAGSSGVASSLSDLLDLVARAGGHLIVNESYGLGALGVTGLGRVEEENLLGREITQVLGFEPNFGVTGAALCSVREVCALVRGTPEFGAQVGLSPSTCAAIESAFDLALADATLRSRLRVSALRIYNELRTMGFRLGGTAGIPIISVMLDSQRHRDELISALFERGILVAPVINPPAKEFAHAIHLTVSALHLPEQVTTLLQAFEDIGKRLGILKS